LPEPEGKAVVFVFEGPIFNIYTTLAVRLAQSGLFKKQDLWKNAVTYTTSLGGTYGIYLRNIGRGRGELTLFFGEAVSEEMRFNFEEYVRIHLQRWALPESIKRWRIFVCDGCNWVITNQLVQLLASRGFHSLDCPVCHKHITLLDREQRLVTTSSLHIIEMDRTADNQRDHEILKSTRQGERAIKRFDVFLCYNNADKLAVKKISEQLQDSGLHPWLDEEQLQPGLPWQQIIEEEITQIKAAAVFVSRNGSGPWQKLELDAFLREFVRRGCPVIPVLLTDVAQEPAGTIQEQENGVQKYEDVLLKRSRIDEKAPSHTVLKDTPGVKMPIKA